MIDDPEEEAWLLLEKRLKNMERPSPCEEAFSEFTSTGDRQEAWRAFEAGWLAAVRQSSGRK